MVMHLRTSSNLRSRLKIFSFPSIAFLHAKMRFRISDVPSNVSKGLPDFCTVYVIHEGKISSVRNASRSSPFNSPLLAQIQKQTDNCSFQFAEPSRHSFQFAARSGHSFQGHARHRSLSMKGAEMMRQMPRNLQDDHETITKILICSPDIYYVKQRYVVFITLGFRGFKASPVDKSSSPLLLYVEADTLSRNSNLTSGNTSKITQEDQTLRRRRRTMREKDLVELPSESCSLDKEEYLTLTLLPFVLHLGFMAGVAFLVMHVQVATRFLSANPPIYWFAASLPALSEYGKRWGYLIWAYCAAYILLGTLLFSNFYPFT